ncbi:hypothetical protein IH992_21755 [Candidatus Poribacteria bacterium]|nr:hypothetical protein [Candidatus Poribacteria bacterium]
MRTLMNLVIRWKLMPSLLIAMILIVSMPVSAQEKKKDDTVTSNTTEKEGQSRSYSVVAV